MLNRTSLTLFFARISIVVVVNFLTIAVFAQKREDFTARVLGAACNNAQYWTITPSSTNGRLVCDTWSSRGDKDGSYMTTPFMEYHMDASSTQIVALDNAEIRHIPIKGLPRGRYAISMKVRCYAESPWMGEQYVYFDTYLYANGKSVPIVSGAGWDTTKGYTCGVYKKNDNEPIQVFGYTTKEIECEVGSDGILDFGLIVNKKDFQNWVAWKDVKLYYLGCEDVESGTYYLRNKATNQYINAGGLWGTQGVFSQYSMGINLTRISGNTFVLDSSFENPNNGYNQWAVGTEGTLYLELGNNNSYTWTITSKADNYFTIQSMNGGYLGYDGNLAVATNLTNPNVDEAQWEIISHTERVNNLLIGKETDATFLISDPYFDRNKSNKWFGIFNKGGYGLNESSVISNSAAEVWNGTFDVYQTITNIPNGSYVLTVQGFYRYNNTNDNTSNIAKETHKNGTEQLLAYYYGNEVQAPLQSIVEHINELENMPGNNALARCAYAFMNGYYENTPIEVNVTDHKLTIGIRKSELPGCDWTVFDNFTLMLQELGDNTQYSPLDNDSPEIPNELFEGASLENPIDITSLIINADCSSSQGWKGSPKIGGLNSNPNAEKYNSTFDVYQIIENVPNGLYKLKVQGMYRYGTYSYEEAGGNNVMAMLTIPYATISKKLGVDRRLAVLYANDTEVGLPSPLDYARTQPLHDSDKETEFGWVPNTQSGLSMAFDTGDYSIELLVPVTENKLRIGVKKPKYGYKNDWAAWDNFELFYLGSEDFILAEKIQIVNSVPKLCIGDQYKLNIKIDPINAVNPKVQFTSQNNNVVTVDENGIITANGFGQTNVTAYIISDDKYISTDVTIDVIDAMQEPSVSNLTINEIQVSNTDMFLDPSYNYSGYIELALIDDMPVNLDGTLWISDEATIPHKFRVVCDRSCIGGVSNYALIWDYLYEDLLDMDGGTIYLSDNHGNLLSSVSYPPALSRTSYARTTDGGETWAITAYPTPNATNDSCKEYLDAISYYRHPLPEVSEESKVFETPFTICINIPEGAMLYYTTDGSTPTDAHGTISPDGIFTIDKTTILRLRFYEEGTLPSPVKTLSYIYKDKNYTLPVLSVVSDPDYFYNDTIGVFVPGTNGVSGSGIDYPCNWNQEWERAVSYNYIANDGTEGHSQEVSLKRFGGWSRSWYPFNFKLKATSVYENNKYMLYPFFENKPSLRHKVLQVRNGGNDLLCRIKDASLQHMIISSGFYIDCQDYQPVHSFINGHYQGMLNLREPSNKHYALANYGIDTDEIDQMEFNWGVGLNAGSDVAFQKWHSLSYSASDPIIYEQICEIVDVDEFINYMAVQLYLGGDDWPQNNCKGFKGHDGKFHIVLFDIDQAFRMDGSSVFNHLENTRGCPLMTIFFNMLENMDFRKQFIDSYCLVGGSIFEPNRCAEIIDCMAEEMRPALALEGLSPDKTVNRVKSALTTTRRNTMMTALRNWYYARIDGNELSMNISSNTSAAKIRLNNIEIPTGKFVGTIFTPAILTAVAPEGYIFKGWKNESGYIVNSNPEYDISHDGNQTLIAVFERMTSPDELKKAIATPVKINEVSAGNNIYASEYFKRSDWFELYNATDTEINVAGLYVSDDIDNPLKYQIPSDGVYDTYIPANGFLTIWADELKGESHIHANFKLKNESGNAVVLTSSQQFVDNNPNFYASHPELTSFIDGLMYTTQEGDESVGRYPNGGSNIYLMSHPTFAKSNLLLNADSLIGEDINYMDAKHSDFTLYLSEGWNWVSHNLNSPISVQSLPDEVTRVVGFRNEVFHDGKAGMVGDLQSLGAGNLYKIQMSSSYYYRNEGELYSSRNPIPLKPGWNWIGYTPNGAQTVTNALSGNLLEDGDIIVGQDGFSTYDNGIWSGTLTTLETGKGYMYKTYNAKSISFNTPDVAVNYSKARSRSRYTSKYNKHAYSNVMGVIATIQSDDVIASATQLSIYAYCDNECRGEGQWIDSLLYITIYGSGNENIRFKAVDERYGTQYYILETSNFISDIEGSVTSPKRLTLITEEEDDVNIKWHEKNDNLYEERVIGYYTLSGILVSQNKTDLPVGTYIVLYENGTRKKLCIK